MNLTKNQRNLLIGGAVLVGGYLVWRYFIKPKSGTSKSAPLTTEEKIIYIIDNAPETYASFSVAEGTTGIQANPTSLVVAEVRKMTPQEIDVTYRIIKARKENSSITTDEISDSLGIPLEMRVVIKEKVRNLIQNINNAKKDPNWASNWERKKETLLALIESHQGRGNSAQALQGVLDRREQHNLDRGNRNNPNQDDTIVRGAPEGFQGDNGSGKGKGKGKAK